MVASIKEKTEGASCGAPWGVPSGAAIPRADARGAHAGLRRAIPQPETRGPHCGCTSQTAREVAVVVTLPGGGDGGGCRRRRGDGSGQDKIGQDKARYDNIR